MLKSSLLVFRWEQIKCLNWLASRIVFSRLWYQLIILLISQQTITWCVALFLKNTWSSIPWTMLYYLTTGQIDSKNVKYLSKCPRYMGLILTPSNEPKHGGNWMNYSPGKSNLHINRQYSTTTRRVVCTVSVLLAFQHLFCMQKMIQLRL